MRPTPTKSSPPTWPPEPEDTGMVLAALPGQHHLLGWHITAADLAFLVSIHADLDVDEYG
ncbi:hypothetical protein GCM10022255_092280 [Dactylosporangium darangshiense]|uniref:Uncharacterized protein n=1 Tax=Dactylosporangium darangshiense TaxID=579108 RepID=A0ABP8DPG5_9ACTN